MSEVYVIVRIDLLGPVDWLAMVWLSCSAGCDILITVIQVVHLHKNRTGIDRTNRVINLLILYIMSTGLLTRGGNTLGWNYVHVFISVPLGGLRGIGPDADTFKTTGGRRFGVSAIQFNTPSTVARPEELFSTKPDTIDINMSAYKIVWHSAKNAMIIIGRKKNLVAFTSNLYDFDAILVYGPSAYETSWQAKDGHDEQHYHGRSSCLILKELRSYGPQRCQAPKWTVSISLNSADPRANQST
ncbi:hypothetical protein BJ912DRAFT_1047730 [Pholiota molesta]|nr:hypothetical protein BJ912DRAFT_1047730 [Pholiota molesta]